MPRTRVKICGITRPEDALAAAAAGADAIGLVFHARSPRHVHIERAAAISAALPAFVTAVALFKDAEAATVSQVLAKVGIDLLQFHGNEPADFCRGFDRPYIKALGMLGDHDVLALAAPYHDARGILLDAHAPGEDGGTGRRFDWNMIPAALSDRLILAGGLRPANVYDAVCTTRPYAVDVSSGVESAPGIKSAVLINEFINEVKRADG
jgi:phosphoribosylanthranilate isomerase